MTDRPGLRQRKKERTRRALIDAAARLFDELGYDRTTVAEIAAAAEVSPRTFFSYFPSKEDVLFADTEERLRVALAVLDAPAPHEPVPELLRRAVEQMLASTGFQHDLTGELGTVRLRLLAEVPALRAAGLRRLLDGQAAMADALHRAYPDRLTEPAAAATVGAFLGALLATALASLRRGDDRSQLPDQLRLATTVALRGIAADPEYG